LCEIWRPNLSVTSLITSYENCKVYLGEFSKAVLKNKLMVLYVQEILREKFLCRFIQWLHGSNKATTFDENVQISKSNLHHPGYNRLSWMKFFSCQPLKIKAYGVKSHSCQ